MPKAQVKTKKGAVDATLRAYLRNPDYSGLLALERCNALVDDYGPKALLIHPRYADPALLSHCFRTAACLAWPISTPCKARRQETPMIANTPAWMEYFRGTGSAVYLRLRRALQNSVDLCSCQTRLTSSCFRTTRPRAFCTCSPDWIPCARSMSVIRAKWRSKVPCFTPAAAGRALLFAARMMLPHCCLRHRIG